MIKLIKAINELDTFAVLNAVVLVLLSVVVMNEVSRIVMSWRGCKHA